MSAANELRQLFISYSSRDKEMVTAVVQGLERRGVSLYQDTLDEQLPGRLFMRVIEERLRKATTVAVFIGSGSLGEFQRYEAALAVILAATKGTRVVPVLLPGAGQIANLELFMQCFSWVDLREGITDERIERLAQVCIASPSAPVAVLGSASDFTLSTVLKGTKERLLIAGHTLDKFTGDEEVKEELINLARQGKRIAILQLNPDSPYAAAHRPFHELESRSSADRQYDQTLNFFRDLFPLLNPIKRSLIDVVYSNYMPRFRTVIVDNVVYVYLYMYGGDVADVPDLQLKPSTSAEDMTRRRILYSTLSAVYAPDSIPLIRSGQMFLHWRKTHISKWSEWTDLERSHHKLTHDFYIAQAEAFDARYGLLLEDYVQAHLDQTEGSTLVLGCGSGKEVEYISQKRQDYVWGVDSSHVAIKRARERCGNPERLVLGDFYDLDVPEFLDGRQFGSIIANAAFVHLLNRDDIDAILRKIWSRLKDGGVLFIRCLYKEQRGQPLKEEVDKWGPRWFVYYSPKELAQKCRESGFDVDLKTTEQIFASCGRDLQIARDKGAKHAQYKEIYWSCVLARKLGQAQP